MNTCGTEGADGQGTEKWLASELLKVPTPTKALPQEQLLKLTTQLLESNFGVEDPELLGESFTFSGPVVGPLKKEEFLKTLGTFTFKDAFPDLD